MPAAKHAPKPRPLAEELERAAEAAERLQREEPAQSAVNAARTADWKRRQRPDPDDEGGTL